MIFIYKGLYWTNELVFSLDFSFSQNTFLVNWIKEVYVYSSQRGECGLKSDVFDHVNSWDHEL